MKNKVAIITGGDSGIGRAIALLYALEGANGVMSYFDEHNDAKQTKEMVELTGRLSRCRLYFWSSDAS